MNLSIRLFSKLYVQTNFSSVIRMMCVMKNNYDNTRELNWYRYRVYLLTESNNFTKIKKRFLRVHTLILFVNIIYLKSCKYFL